MAKAKMSANLQTESVRVRCGTMKSLRSLIKKSKNKKIFVVEFVSDAIEEKMQRENQTGTVSNSQTHKIENNG